MKPKKVGRKKLAETGHDTAVKKKIKIQQKILKILDKYFFGEVNEDGNVVYKKLGELLRPHGISTQLFHYYIKTDNLLFERYHALRESKVARNIELAENNITSALTREGTFSDLESKEVAKLSLDFLKQTDRLYNPKMNIEVESKNLDLSISMDDLYKQFEKFKGM